MTQLIKKIKPIYGALSAVRRIVMGNYMRKCHKKHGLDSNKVVFSSFKGASCSDSPLAIAKALHELRPETDRRPRMGATRGPRLSRLAA